MVEIEGITIEACWGTHVKSTGEIKGIQITKRQKREKAIEEYNLHLKNDLEPIRKVGNACLKATKGLNIRIFVLMM